MKELDPKEYFDYLKNKKNEITDDELVKSYDAQLLMVEKYLKTGQKKLLRKLKFLSECIDAEREIVKLGINSFVYRDDVEEYIDDIAKNTVKLIELENYPRDIPDEIVDVIDKVKPIFTQMYVVFTDYTGKVEKEVEKERRQKDPILFGTFQKKIKRKDSRSNVIDEILINDRFYYIADWEDEYCDLTMDKFLREAGKDKLKEIGTPTNVEQVKEALASLDDDLKITQKPEKKPFFKKIFSKIK